MCMRDVGLLDAERLRGDADAAAAGVWLGAHSSSFPSLSAPRSSAARAARAR